MSVPFCRVNFGLNEDGRSVVLCGGYLRYMENTYIEGHNKYEFILKPFFLVREGLLRHVVVPNCHQ